MTNELISVLVPVYNCEKYIESCINSILNQTYSNFEIIVVDDGSKDNSYKLLENLASKDKRIKLYQKENEKSVSITRNYLLSKINGDYFIFVDSDDCVSSNYLQLLYDAIKKDNSDVACCGFTITNNCFTRSKKLKKLTYYDNRKDALEEMILGKTAHFMVWNKLIRTSCLNTTKFDDDLHYGEDFVFVFNLLQSDLKVSVINNKLYFYRLRKGSITHSGLDNSKEKFLNRLLEMENNEKYLDDKALLSTWIYVTSGLYLELIRLGHKGKNSKDMLRGLMSERYLEFNSNKKLRKLYRSCLNFIKILEKVEVK